MLLPTLEVLCTLHLSHEMKLSPFSELRLVFVFIIVPITICTSQPLNVSRFYFLIFYCSFKLNIVV